MTSSSPFSKHKFYILPVKLDQEKQKSVEDGIAALDGTCLSDMNDATFIITVLKSPVRIQRHVRNSTCPVVHINWITECVTQRRFLNPDPYRIYTAQTTTNIIIANSKMNDTERRRPRQMRSWDEIYDVYRQQCQMPVSKHAVLHGYHLTSKKKKTRTKLRREPSYQTTTSGESSLDQEHPWWAETSLYQTTSFVCERPSPVDHPNKALVDIFEFLEHARELRGEMINGLSYRKAAAVLKGYPYKIKSVNEALQLKGIGKKTGRIMDDYLKTGNVPDIASLKEDTEFKTLELFYNVHGVGAATAREWYHKGYRSLADVEKNEYLTKDQKLGIKYYDDFIQRIPREKVDIIANELRSALEDHQPGCKLTLCGSYRRGKPFSGDVDILVTHPDDKVTKSLLTSFVAYLRSLGLIKDILSMSHCDPFRHNDADTDDSNEDSRNDDDENGDHPNSDSGQSYTSRNRQALCVWKSKDDAVYRRLDLIVVAWCDYPVAILGWTGSSHFNRSLRLRAKRINGLKVTSHGIFRKGKKLHVDSERHAFEILDLPYLEPSQRNC